MMDYEARKGLVMYKSQLQEYAQKAAIPLPVYEFVKEGPAHYPTFKATVIVNGVSHESPPGFPNVKLAEQAAAKVALDALLETADGPEVPRPVSGHGCLFLQESGLCKTLLQAYAQKNGLLPPKYQSQRFGEANASVFYSCVEIAGVQYCGGPAKNKKLAKIQAARAAWLAIQSSQSRDLSPNPLHLPPHVQSDDQLDSTNIFDWRNIPQYRDFTSYEPS